MTFRDIDKDFSGGVFNLKEAEDGGTIIRNGGGPGVGDHLIHTSGTESGLDNINDCFDGVNVGDDLSDTLHGLSTISEKKNGGLLTYKKRITSKWLMLF